MSQQAADQAVQNLVDAGWGIFDITADLLTKGLYGITKIVIALGKAKGGFNHASKMRVAEAYAKKKGISVNAAFMELDQMGIFDDYDY
ncbi:hypothetical protein ABK040_005621 [Willaertia magna]